MIHEDTFAFVVHPIHLKSDVARKYPLLGKVLSEGMINWLSRYFPPVYLSQIDGIQSQATERFVTGWFLAVPYTPQRMLTLPENMVYDKIVAAGNKAKELGAKMFGLGAFTSVVGDSGVTIAERLDIPVTTGDSYTVVIAVEAIREAARRMEIDITQAEVAVVGATGAIGKTCAQMLARDVGKLNLIGRRPAAVQEIRERCEGYAAEVTGGTDIETIYSADLILTVTSAVETIIKPRHLKPGAVVLDVARPRDVSQVVAQERDDVLVIEGGMVEVPGDANFNFDFGFPPGKVYACMAETIALALESRYTDYTLGKEISLEQAQEIGQIAARHGFKLSGFRSFERAVTDAHIDAVRERASINRRAWMPANP